jgi:hypothetical protein
MKLSTIVAHAALAIEPATNRIDAFKEEVRAEMHKLRVDRAIERAYDAGVPATEVAKTLKSPQNPVHALEELAERWTSARAHINKAKDAGGDIRTAPFTFEEL